MVLHIMALKDEYLTISQAAEELGITRQTISRWVAKGEIQAERIGRETLIHKDELQSIESRFDENIRNYIIKRLISNVRKQFHYTREDKIEEIEPSKKFLRLSVTRKNGTHEILRVSFIDITKDNIITFNVDKIDKARRKIKS